MNRVFQDRTPAIFINIPAAEKARDVYAGPDQIRYTGSRIRPVHSRDALQGYRVDLLDRKTSEWTRLTNDMVAQ